MDIKEVQRPVPFIQERNGKFFVAEEAVQFLSKIHQKIAVITVAGPYRTGASYAVVLS